MRTFGESKKIYIEAATRAGIPRKYRVDGLWRQMGPENIKSIRPVIGEEYAKALINDQITWRNALINNPKWFTKSVCVVVFGDYLAEAAERFAYGMAGFALRNNMRVKAFHIRDLIDRGSVPKEIDGTQVKYDVVVVNRIHTDDGPERRAMVRDVVTKFYPGTFVVLVVYGHEPIDFFYQKIGISPEAIFFFPYHGRELGSRLLGKNKNH